MKYAYIRVSTQEQNTARQQEAMKGLGIGKYFEEKLSGKNADRPELQKLLAEVRSGDAVYIVDFSRLARNVQDLLDITGQLEKKGVGLISLKEGFDTAGPFGRLMLTLIGGIAEFERAIILERQRDGIKIAKKEGKSKGRKKISYPPTWEKYYPLWKRREITGTVAMAAMKLKRNTFYRLIKEYEAAQ
jgi:DNA invertase Pin-like site-specific DNA recombinase